jgi:hypothetical protein
MPFSTSRAGHFSAKSLRLSKQLRRYHYQHAMASGQAKTVEVSRSRFWCHMLPLSFVGRLKQAWNSGRFRYTLFT